MLREVDMQERTSWKAVRAAASDLAHLCSLTVSGTKRVGTNVVVGEQGRLVLKVEKPPRSEIAGALTGHAMV